MQQDDRRRAGFGRWSLRPEQIADQFGSRLVHAAKHDPLAEPLFSRGRALPDGGVRYHRVVNCIRVQRGLRLLLRLDGRRRGQKGGEERREMALRTGHSSGLSL